MTDPRLSQSTVESPGERAHADDVEGAHQPVPSVDATGTEAAAAGVHPGTVAESVTHADAAATAAPRVVTDVGAAAPGQEVEVECPGCGLILVGDSPRPTAAWFCPKCDYPVFWASPPPPGPTPQRRARRRLPGTSGATVLGAGPCWNCGEMNEPDSTACIRCAATLPRPVAPKAETRVVTVQQPVPIPFPLPTTVWPYVVAGTLAGAAVATSGTLWVLRLAGRLVGGG